MDPKQHVIWGNLAEVYSEIAKTKTGAEKDAALAKVVRELQEGDRAGSHRRQLLQQLCSGSRPREQDP